MIRNYGNLIRNSITTLAAPGAGGGGTAVTVRTAGDNPPAMSAERKGLCEVFTKTHVEAEAIRKEWQGKEKDMPADVVERWEKALDDADALERRIKALDRAESSYKFATEPAPETRITRANTDAREEVDTKALQDALQGPLAGFDSPELRSCYKKVLKGDMQGRTWSVEERAAMNGAVNKKAQTFSEDAAGGYLVAPMQFVTELIARVKDQCFIRQLSRNIPVIGGASLGVPYLATDLSDADWTNELTAANDDQIGIGKRELRPNYLSKLVTISRPLLRQAALDPEAIVSDRAAYKFAITEEKAFLLGDGNKKPLGVFVASTDGISVARDKASGTANDFKGDDLIDLYGNLKTQYRPYASWMFHRDGMTKIRKMKDGVGNYIWQPFDFQGRMLTGAYPGLILGRPYYESEYVPNTYTTGNYYGLIGDFRNYWIATSLMLDVQVLVEQYALTNRFGYIFRAEVDAMPTLEEAFSRGKVG